MSDPYAEERENLIEGDPIAVVDELLALRRMHGRLVKLRNETSLKIGVGKVMQSAGREDAALKYMLVNLSAQLQELGEVLDG